MLHPVLDEAAVSQVAEGDRDEIVLGVPIHELPRKRVLGQVYPLAATTGALLLSLLFFGPPFPLRLGGGLAFGHRSGRWGRARQGPDPIAAPEEELRGELRDGRPRLVQGRVKTHADEAEQNEDNQTHRDLQGGVLPPLPLLRCGGWRNRHGGDVLSFLLLLLCLGLPPNSATRTFRPQVLIPPPDARSGVLRHTLEGVSSRSSTLASGRGRRPPGERPRRLADADVRASVAAKMPSRCFLVPAGKLARSRAPRQVEIRR